MDVWRWFRKAVKKDKPLFNVSKIESVIGYHFKDTDLLYRSLKHRSYSHAREGNIALSNERLEFLGDSVLNMVVSHYIFEKNPDFQEGDLTKLKSTLVSRTTAMIACHKTGIDNFVLLSDSEENAGGRNRLSIIAGVYEAVIGAIFLDGGIEAARDFIKWTILNDINLILSEELTNYKSLLLELTQAEKLGHPTYHTIHEDGPDHNKIFTIEVSVKGNVIGKGKGKSKKVAQQMAAKEGLERFENN